MDTRKDYNWQATAALEKLLSTYTNGNIMSFAEMDVELVEEYLNEDADPNVLADEISLIHLLIQLELSSQDADRNKCIDFIETLVKTYGADINIRAKIDSKNVTPLQYFMNLNEGLWDIDLVKIQALRLVQLGAKKNAKDKNGNTLQSNLANTSVSAKDEPTVIFEMRPSLLEESKAELKLIKEDLKVMYEKAKSSSAAKNAAAFFYKSREKLKHYAEELKVNVNEKVEEVKYAYHEARSNRRKH